MTMLEKDEDLTILEQRDKLLAGATKAKLLSPATCTFTIEEMYTTIDKVITQISKQPEALQNTIESISYPHSELQGPDYDNSTTKLHDPNTNLKEMSHIPKGLLMKQRAVDLYCNDIKDNTAIISKIHHYVDIYISNKANLDIGLVKVLLGNSQQ